ncbi:hypothetical protein [Streptomyces sp. NPDC058861]|uniref:hypothetical protein n=1 Tax=Streptomyces sp. NPDC058861 TaxID=3346653 RepID=UPI0036CF2590
MEPMDSTEPIDLQPPCNCGALGDHPSTPDCVHQSVVTAEVSGTRSACLEAVGVLRTSYAVDIKTQWQDPQNGQWVFHLALAGEVSRVIRHQSPVPPVPSPDAAVLVCMESARGLEITKEEIYVVTGLEDAVLSHSLNFLVENGAIECVRPGVYRKPQ